MVHVSGKLDGILGAINLETSFIHHTVIYVISSANLMQFAIPLSFFFSHLAPTVLQPATKATCWKWCKWCHHHAFKSILPAFVLFIQWLQPWKKDLYTLQKSNMKMTSWKITIFSKETHLQMVDVPLSCLFSGGCIFLKLLGNISLWPVSTFHFWKPSSRKDAVVLIPLIQP